MDPWLSTKCCTRAAVSTGSTARAGCLSKPAAEEHCEEAHEHSAEQHHILARLVPAVTHRSAVADRGSCAHGPLVGCGIHLALEQFDLIDHITDQQGTVKISSCGRVKISSCGKAKGAEAVLKGAVVVKGTVKSAAVVQ